MSIVTRRTRARRALLPAALLSAVILALAADLALLVFPPANPRARADLVVVLGPFTHGPRLQVAHDIARLDDDTLVLVSVTDVDHDCPVVQQMMTGLNVTCFRPRPFTTRGEARGAARLAQSRSLKRVAVVASQDQLVRAGLRFRRCVDGDVRLAVAGVPLRSRLALLPYQNAAMAKALVVQRSC